MDELAIPYIHLNGTSKTSLLDGLGKVHIALEEAAQKLREAAPNGRDAYPVPGLMKRLEAQHVRRLKTIRDLQEEIYAEMDEILKQAGGR